MLLRVAGDADTEVVVLFADQRDKFVGISQTAFGLHELGLTLRRITSQCHDVADASRHRCVEPIKQFLARRPDTGEVRCRGYVEPLLNLGTQIDRLPPRAAASSVGAGNERRVPDGRLFEHVEQRLVAFLGLRREDFDRQAEWNGLIDFANPHERFCC